MVDEKVDVANITKFDGRNYRQWKFQMKCALKAKGLYDIANGVKLNPGIAEPQENNNWIKQDAIAMFTLTSAMSLSQITLIENCETSSDIFNKLNSIYEQKSETNKMLVHERFHQYKMSLNDSISQHIAKVENLAQQIKETGENLSDIAIITKILGSLPPKYRFLRQAWLSMDEIKQTIPNLTARLLDEEANLTVSEDSETALSVSKSSSCGSTAKLHKPKYTKGKRSNVICYNCQKKGHFARDCRAPKKTKDENFSNNKEKNTQLNISAFTSETNHEMLNVADDNEFWIMDSATFAHMTQ